jgi:hypothetical protein
MGDSETVTSLLKDNPRLVFAKGPEGSTPLSLAAQHAHFIGGGHADVVKILLGNNAEVNATEDDGSTPLHLASVYGSTFIADLLISKGAQINFRDRKGRTPLHIAAAWDVRQMMIGREPRTVKLLLANKADKNARNEEGCTPLQSSFDKYTDILIQEKKEINLECVGCGRTYTPGKDAICITKDEMVALKMAQPHLDWESNIMVGRVEHLYGLGHISYGNARLRKEQDRGTIIKLASKGWVCRECHANNYWQLPDFPSELASLLQ